MGIIQQQTEKEELRVLVVDPPGGEIAFIIGPEQFVELTARAVTVVGAARHVEQGEPLARLAQRLRRCGDQPETDLRHLDEILLPLPIVLRQRPVAGGKRQMADPALNPLDRINLRLKELLRNRIVTELLQRGTRFVEQSAPAE